MGVDVFGRGTYGGGGMACAAAAQVALRAGTSLALFAPGWVVSATLHQLEAQNSIGLLLKPRIFVGHHHYHHQL